MIPATIFVTTIVIIIIIIIMFITANINIQAWTGAEDQLRPAPLPHPCPLRQGPRLEPSTSASCAQITLTQLKLSDVSRQLNFC